MAPYHRPRLSASRSTLVAALLALTLGLTGVLAHQAVDASRSHERIAEQTVKEHALFASWELSSAIRRDLFSHFMGMGLEVVAKSGGAYSSVPFTDVKVIRSGSRQVGWWPGMEEGGLDYAFRYDFSREKLDFVGPNPPEERVRQWLVGRLKDRADFSRREKKISPWGMVLHGPGEDRRVVVMAVDPMLGSEGLVGFGFQTRLQALEPIFKKIEEGTPLLPPALTKDSPNAQVLSFVVADRRGQEVYRSQPQYDSKYTAGDTVGSNYGGLNIKIHLRPAILESMVIGGLPRSRLPIILGLLILTAGLVLTAIFQIRREQELSRLRADFVSSVSHQLRTPLAQIRMFGETLLLGRVRSEEERQRSLEIIVKESRRLTHQVDNVLLFSRAQRNDVRLNPVDTELAPLVRETLESFCPLAEAQDCRVESTLEDGLRALVDPESVSQILLNLMENALKYGPRNQIVDVEVVSGPSGTARLVVQDEGSGVPKEDREAVFSPYARLGRDRDSGVAGSGIGLAVVKELVEHQGGRVRVEDARSGGARFVVEFPSPRGA